MTPTVLAILLIGYGLGLMTAAYTLAPDTTALLGGMLVAVSSLYIVITDDWWK